MGTAITVGGAGGSSTDKFTNPFTIEVLKNNYLSFSTPVSIDIDGESFAAARFSGELQIESSSSISTSNDGGSTTVTGSQNSFRMVSMKSYHPPLVKLKQLNQLFLKVTSLLDILTV